MTVPHLPITASCVGCFTRHRRELEMWTGWIIYGVEDGDWLRERVTCLTNPVNMKQPDRAEAEVTMTDAQLDALMPFWGRVIWGMATVKETE